MKHSKLVALTAIFFFLVSCATPLSSLQKQEYKAFEEHKVLVEKKSPGTGAVLGLFLGMGSFYAEEPGYGIVNLLLWPFSILWDPISGSEGAKAINYHATKAKLDRDMREELRAIEERLATDEIEVKDYILLKRAIEDRYVFD